MNNNEIQTVVITGASGFLGSHLVDRLKNNAKYKIYALSTKWQEKAMSYTNSNVCYVSKEFCFQEEGKQILQDAIVINCAFPRNSSGVFLAEGMTYLAEFMKMSAKNNIKAFINISSQSVYSTLRNTAATEKTPVCPESNYAVAKYAMELITESVFEDLNIKYTNLRLASLIGPGFDQRIVNRFVKQALETGEIKVKDNKQLFGFFDVEDAVTAIISMLSHSETSWEKVYNLGCLQIYTLIEIATAVKKEIEKDSKSYILIETTSDDSFSNSSLDSTLFEKDFRFVAEVSIQESIKRIVDYYKKGS